jgi:hypothetical protein
MSEWTVLFLSLAQTATRPDKRQLDQATWSLVVLFVVVLAAFMIAGLVIYVVRSRALKSDTTGSRVPLTLAELRRMHRSGEIDDEEMERLKDIVTAQTTSDLTKPRERKK